MKRRWLTRILCVAFAAFNLACCTQWYLDPSRHFGTALPSLSATIPSSASAPPSTDGSSNTSDLPPADLEVPPDSFNVLILGLDGGGARTDVIMLANINPGSRKVILLSIPRDTAVAVPGLGVTKINHAHYWGESHGGNTSGTELATSTVEEFLGCEIRYYVKIDFEGYKNFIDTVGGVDINLPHEIVVNESDKTFTAGFQHLDGETALVLVRERFTLPDGDFGRQRLQYLVIASLAQKLLHPDYILKLPELASQVMDEVVNTNLSVTDGLSLAILFEGMTASDITYMQVPGTEGYALDPLVGRELFYWIPDPAGLRELTRIFAGNSGD